MSDNHFECPNCGYKGMNWSIGRMLIREQFLQFCLSKDEDGKITVIYNKDLCKLHENTETDHTYIGNNEDSISCNSCGYNLTKDEIEMFFNLYPFDAEELNDSEPWDK